MHALNNTTRTLRHDITYKTMAKIGPTSRSLIKLHTVTNTYEKLQNLQQVAKIVVIEVSNT